MMIMEAVRSRGWSLLNYMTNWISWCPTSAFELELAEMKILSYLRRPHRGYYVDIGPGWGLENNKIWTVEMEQSDNKLTGEPLVLLHGFASGVGLWIMNLDHLSSQNRKVYAIDILGFGRSSRPYFNPSEEVEFSLTESIERWRLSLGLDKNFILLGHSFGAYLAFSYALHYPAKVSHLIMADPWGIPSQQQVARPASQYQVPMWVKMVSVLFFQSFNPLAGLRLAGPWGPRLVEKVRPDLRRKFEQFTGSENADLILNYVYHCNAQSNPSGEAAFKSLSQPMGWAKYPIIHRVNNLHPSISLTFIYGSRSWIDRQPAFQIKYLLGDSRVSVDVIQGAGHHVYADKPEEFNQIVSKACIASDEKKSFIASETMSSSGVLRE